MLDTALPFLKVDAYDLRPSPPHADWSRWYRIETDRGADGTARLIGRRIGYLLLPGVSLGLMKVSGLDIESPIAELANFRPHGTIPLGRRAEFPFMRRGIGRRALDLLCEEAWSRGAEGLFVLGPSESMLGFCEKMNFKPFESWVPGTRMSVAYYLAF